MLTTKTGGVLTKAQKDEKITNARNFHAKLLEDNGATQTQFNLKLPFSNNGEKVIGIFPSEFKYPNGFFLEFINSNLDPIDEKRTVYRVRPTENYEDVYDILRGGQYAVPLEDLEVVTEKKTAPAFKVNREALTEVKDDNISNMTITDFAAIMWMKPVSEKEWLNNLIQQNIV